MCNKIKHHGRMHRHPRYEHLKHEHFKKWANAKRKYGSFFYPPTNIVEEADHYLLSLKVPGYNKDEFKIAVLGNELRISVDSKNVRNENINHQEFARKAFKRQFELNEKIDNNAIKAEYKDGILELRLDKKEEFRHEEIEIKVD